MADTTITLTIPEANVNRIIAAIKATYPIENGFTDNQWVKESIRRIIIRDVQRYENEIAREAAIIQSDDTLVN